MLQTNDVMGAIDPVPLGSLGDFDFFVGTWRVAHRRLVGRLVGSTTWEEFEGESTMRKILGGTGNIDENVIRLPKGTYEAVTLRLFNPDTRLWSIYWIDGRMLTIDSPMVGGFEGRHGLFYGDDMHQGQPVRVRFRWFDDAPDRCRWEQAFSIDGGQSWETNWYMDNQRIG